MLENWMSEIKNIIANNYDSSMSEELAKKYSKLLPMSYCEKNGLKIIIMDVDVIEKMMASKFKFDCTTFSNPIKNTYHIRLYHFGPETALSDILPVLDSMGFRTIKEDSWSLSLENASQIVISDFTVEMPDFPESIQLENADESTVLLCKEALRQMISGSAEIDGFNRLIVAAGLSCREVSLIRAYAKYLGQIKFRFSRSQIEKTLFRHANTTKTIINFFTALHEPSERDLNDALSSSYEINLSLSLDKIRDIDDDTIIRRFLILVRQTLRTNFFKKDPNGKFREFITLKLSAKDIPDVPLPCPLFDTFVYAPSFEGIHLRSHKISRGGIRWSDRVDDYRTEVLALMKAQKVKNSIIIPSGAKGGFIIRNLTDSLSPENRSRRVVDAYSHFIEGLLDITDNIKGDSVIQPEQIVCRDDPDPYFVVAADKGTATFSDVANTVSKAYDFWLSDAFASGGSNGYDHKKIGITAKGAWESVKRHLQELGRTEDAIVTVGIGDMSGDVFGNGMLNSKNIRLVAAFDHRHIFLDPTPDPVDSWEERQRLFGLPKSDWTCYQSELISKGGGVYNRSEKTILISPEVQKILDISKDKLSPDELIRAILCAPVDLLYNGGIGTYVKASSESNEQVGDKINEYCRVNGGDLRCLIVCEGGNLGFSQNARVEYALKGGLIILIL